MTPFIRIPVLASALALTLGLSAGLASGLQDPEPVEVSINELTSIEWKPGEDLPADVEDLDGEMISIEGYMALGTLEGTTKFELVPEPCECGRSKVSHFIDVTLKEGLVSYKPGRIILTGKFEASEVEEDGFIVSLFRLEIESLD